MRIITTLVLSAVLVGMSPFLSGYSFVARLTG